MSLLKRHILFLISSKCIFLFYYRIADTYLKAAPEHTAAHEPPEIEHTLSEYVNMSTAKSISERSIVWIIQKRSKIVRRLGKMRKLRPFLIKNNTAFCRVFKKVEILDLYWKFAFIIYSFFFFLLFTFRYQCAGRLSKLMISLLDIPGNL